jgi:hypothetical protein
MQFIETVSFASRVAGKLVNRLSLGTTLQHSIYVTSRLFLPPLLLSLSFLIESGLSIKLFLLTAFVITIMAFFVSLVIFINLNYFQILFQRTFVQYETNTIPISIVKVLFDKEEKLNQEKLIHMTVTPRIRSLSFKKIAVSSLAYFFLSTGFLIAFSFAILLPDHRMTMSQSTAIFHGIGAIILAMYIDPMISKSLDVLLENDNWLKNIYSIFVGRLLAYLVASSIFLAFYLYTSST